MHIRLLFQYTATKGGGAFCNGAPIHVSTTTRLDQAVIFNNVGATREKAFLRASLERVFHVMNAPCRGMRLGGSAAMNCCYVASGRIDAFWEVGFGGPWDVAAGLILVQEAGGVARAAPGGGAFVLKAGKGDILLGTAAVTAAVAEVMRGCEAGAAGASPAARTQARALELLGAFAFGAMAAFVLARK